MRSFLLLLCTIGLANSLVDFTNSALYDIYDFKGVAEVKITKCDYGCLIFVATMGDTFVKSPDNLDPYASNLIIHNNKDGSSISIAKLATQRQADRRKIPLTVTGQASISVLNKNTDETFFSTIVLYVIERTKAEEFSYEVYDGFYSQNAVFTPTSDIVTILSAYDFRITAQPTIQPNSVTARMTGFDNALDSNKDGCPFVYKTPTTPSFPGFTLMAKAQIMSLFIEKRANSLMLQLDFQFSKGRDLATDGFIASAGWNGCAKPNNGGLQSFRTSDDNADDGYFLSSNKDHFNVTLDVLPNFDQTHTLAISATTDKIESKIITGNQQQHVEFDNTNYIIMNYQGMRGDQGFILKYSSTSISQSTTTGVASSSTSATSSTSQVPSTTSSGNNTAGFLMSVLLVSLLI